MKRLIAIAVAGAMLAFAAVGWAKVSIKVSPTSVKAGGRVTVSGSAGNGCASGDQVTLISKAFAHKHDFAGLPAIFAVTHKGGAFSTTTTIPKSRKPGSYTITGRCGGGNLGTHATLKVTP